jgi:hypothetical protein
LNVWELKAVSNPCEAQSAPYAFDFRRRRYVLGSKRENFPVGPFVA